MDNPLSSIAHSLRTPLTVITSTVNNLLDGTFGSLNVEQKKWLKKVEGHASNLEKLLNQILDLMKDDSLKAARVQEGIATAHPSGPVIHPAALDQASASITEPNAQGTPLVLVVDDEEDIRDVVKEALTMKGYRVLVASNGAEGTALALREHPDVILMDVLLGMENGLQVGQRIKSSLSSYVPVILMTGQEDLREKIAGSPSQPDELLAKPFQMEELFARVGSMTRLKKMADQLVRISQKKP